ncbi:MAG TPA: di-heme oxidoredictase family protein [Burkholderiales bacterium]|nr:di-heme oxidoredictase family protein [Burkholderiales bacterium]
MSRIPVLALAAGALLAAARALPEDLLARGFATEERGPQAYAQPGPLAGTQQQALFRQGEQLFRQRWVVAPSALGRWGRGPLSNGEVCTDCHAGNGRGHPPLTPDEPLRSMLLRLSVAGDPPRPHPAYGDQLQHQGVLGRVPGEGEATMTWRESAVTLGDGTRVQLRRPEVRLSGLNYGPIDGDVLLSARVAPPVFGLGLLEAVPESALLALAERQRERSMQGRLNRVPDLHTGRTVPGRFGLKASQATIRSQVATALHADLGVVSPLFPEENCMPVQRECAMFPSGARPELGAAELDALEFYIRMLAPPARRERDTVEVRHGERLFAQAGCAVCHAPELRTGEQAALEPLARRTIQPYTDLLLHDLGEGLADGRPDLEAGPRDWRTAPLWGLGLSLAVNGNAWLLHDGRARSIEEAILWHGGQGHQAREAYRAMTGTQREALAAFLRSL